jgi:undecaprenyl-diphosphatase
MSIPLGEAAILGVVQGVTEFLPVSSDGHLALAQLLLGNGSELALTVLLRVGTLAATLVVLRKRLWNAIEEGVRGVGRPVLLTETPGGRDATFVALATVPTLVMSLALKKPVEELAGSLVVIGVCFLASALVVATTGLAPRGSKTSPGWAGALLVGVAQGSAVMPGLSRSAMTIASLLWLGVGAERAFELSFLVSIPTVAVTIFLDSRHAFHGDEGPGALASGMLLAFLVGVGALELTRRIVIRRKLHWFAFYLVPVALATLAWGYARP